MEAGNEGHGETVNVNCDLPKAKPFDQIVKADLEILVVKFGDEYNNEQMMKILIYST